MSVLKAQKKVICNMQNYDSVLIIEDDESLSNILSRSFERRDYKVESATNQKEVLEVLKKFHPLYAVVDLKLGLGSGLDCIKILHEFDPNMKIVMLTGYASITTTIEAIKLGACYYLAKPANVDDIIAAFKNDKIIQKRDSVKKTSLKNLEWEYINKTLAEVGFNISKAARILGMHRRTLARKLEKKHL
jgi:two-component system, response regulator RegA